jgi:PAS domain S-box-containing protein
VIFRETTDKGNRYNTLQFCHYGDPCLPVIALCVFTNRVMNDLPHAKLFQNAFHFAAIGMALVGLDGRWLKVNRSLCELVGYSEEELLAGTFQDITHPDDLDLDLAYLGQLVRDEISGYQMEKRYFHKDGHIVWILLHVALARDDSNRPEVFISQINDITGRKAAERELEGALHENQRLVADLRESNKQIEDIRNQFIKMCAWTKRVFYDGQWISMDRFLSEHLRLKITHGISEEAIERAFGGIKNDGASG